ncbi:MAG: metallophosphoesterase family protein [Aureliella sp.]
MTYLLVKVLRDLKIQTFSLRMALCFWMAAIAVADLRGQEIRFTSVPDIFNWNIGNPQPGWEDSLDWFFDRLQKDGPDFTLNAGDIMDARWWEDEAQVIRKTEEYWSGFKKRFDERNMTVYVAPGDHEYGDDGGLKIGDIARAFGQQFTKLMDMPKNGPDNHLGRSYFVRKDNLLIVTLDTFEDEGAKFGYTVGEEQLVWLEKTFRANADADFIIVQGHLPIIGPVRSKNSSASMLEGGEKSSLWRLMVQYDVDVYLCGEHHRITVKEQDGICQIVHGALWGTQTDLNYLRGVVGPKEMTLELLEFDVEYSGGYIGDHPHRSKTNRPRENVALASTTKNAGPRVTGRLVLLAEDDGPVKKAEATGWFDLKAQRK